MGTGMWVTQSPAHPAGQASGATASLGSRDTSWDPQGSDRRGWIWDLTGALLAELQPGCLRDRRAALQPRGAGGMEPPKTAQLQRALGSSAHPSLSATCTAGPSVWVLPGLGWGPCHPPYRPCELPGALGGWGSPDERRRRVPVLQGEMRWVPGRDSSQAGAEGQEEGDKAALCREKGSGEGARGCQAGSLRPHRPHSGVQEIIHRKKMCFVPLITSKIFKKCCFHLSPILFYLTF